MTYYCDYEALLRPRSEFKENLIPPWLGDTKHKKIQIPLCFTACTKNGNIMHSQDYNTNIQPISFLRFLDSILKFNSSHKSHKLYFHNLYYDFSIILYELLYNDFTQYKPNNDNLQFFYLDEKKQRVYSTDPLDKLVIDNTKLFYVYGSNLKKSSGVDILYNGKIFQLRDTYRILTSSQDEILKSYGYELKPKINFDNLNINNPWEIVELRNRNRYDVQSLSQCVEKFLETVKKLYQGAGDTASSIALKAVKSYLGDNFEELYPKISDNKCEKVSRIGYNGGIVQYSRHLEPGEILKNLHYFDINSSYPYTMSLESPYGIPIINNTKNILKSKYAEMIVKIDFKIKENYIPCIRCSSASALKREYGYESKSYHTRKELPLEFSGYLAINTYDIKMLDLYYEYKIEIIEGYEYQTDTHFSKFINSLYKDKYKFKKMGNKVMESACKLILNSLYGKFAQDLSGVNEFITKNGKLSILCEDLRKIYCPLSNSIVSHARYNLMWMINKNPINFVYCDTDSITVFCDYDFLEEGVQGSNIGKWTREYNKIERGKFLGKKNYLLDTDKGLILKCVGLPKDTSKIYDKKEFDKGELKNEEVDFSNFEIGYEFVIQKMKRVYGGLAMDYTTFTIKERTGIYS